MGSEGKMVIDDVNEAVRYGCAEVLAKRLAADIAAKQQVDGARLMPMRQLADKYNTTYFMMRKAVNLLIDKGLLSSRQGSGVYIKNDNKPVQRKFSVVYSGFEEHVASGRFYTSLLYGVEKEAALRNEEIAVSILRDPGEFAKRDIFSSSNGFLIVGDDIPGLADLFRGKPAVWMMGARKEWGDHISYDNRLVGVFAAEELISSGKKNLACINVDIATGDERCRAFKEHAESLGAEVFYLNNPEALITTRTERYIDPDALSGWVDRIEHALPGGLNGVFVAEAVAYPLYNMLVERGIKPGRDIEIATSSWHDLVGGSTPYQPVNILLRAGDVGAVAVRQLRWRINNPAAERMVMRIEPKVEKRDGRGRRKS